ncbi:cytidylate kinase-like family protein [Geodermatophilus sabuli]|uniref:Cytidylate kinase-like family protein n=1 Tax=Geodermatophilus sabuli TaxID=1564158 RepID=A0A7K3VXX4_9ACTN|nr:cytidylate kinase-like family protein [Geodermatophilus sabuli]NEK57499.1 cytidylate kinase-like family protein [Geodermatophilus sabuli]
MGGRTEGVVTGGGGRSGGVVTISASYGAGGADVGPAVAERLGLAFHDRAIPVEVAGRLGVSLAEAEANDERVARGLWRIVASLGAMPDPVGGVVPMAPQPDERAYRQQTERILHEIADGPGGVVLGRAAALVLRDRPDALHVRLDGPPEQRLAAAVARTGHSREEVRRDLAGNDAAREAYVRHFYRCDPAAAGNYHLVVDSTALPLEAVVDLVVTAARARGVGTG